MTIGMQDFLPPVQSLPLGWKIGVKEANQGKVSYKHQWIMTAQLTRLVQVRTTVLEPKQANTTTTTIADECHSLFGRREAGVPRKQGFASDLNKNSRGNPYDSAKNSNTGGRGPNPNL
ncbi:hypothetical protein Peur_015182 [Populus x canadensis]